MAHIFQHPLLDIESLSSGNHEARDRRLVLWCYEAQLKERYLSYLTALQVLKQIPITSYCLP